MKRNAVETRRRLLKAALKLFTKYGFDKVTVEDITRYAGVSKGTFYIHFSTKEQVLVEQFDSIDAFYAQSLAQMDSNASASELALAFIDSMCKFCTDVWGLSFLKIVYMHQISLGDHPPILLKRDRLFYTMIENIVRKGRDNGEFRTDVSIDDQVYLFASSSRSLLYEWCLYNGAFDLRETGRQFCTRVLNNIRTHPLDDTRRDRGSAAAG